MRYIFSLTVTNSRVASYSSVVVVGSIMLLHIYIIGGWFINGVVVVLYFVSVTVTKAFSPF